MNNKQSLTTQVLYTARKERALRIRRRRINIRIVEMTVRHRKIIFPHYSSHSSYERLHVTHLLCSRRFHRVTRLVLRVMQTTITRPPCSSFPHPPSYPVIQNTNVDYSAGQRKPCTNPVIWHSLSIYIVQVVSSLRPGGRTAPGERTGCSCSSHTFPASHSPSCPYGPQSLLSRTQVKDTFGGGATREEAIAA